MFLGDTRLDTPRLSLTPLKLEDASDLQKITNAVEITSAISFLNDEFSIEDARDLIAGVGEKDVFLGVWEKKGNRLIGVLGVHKNDDHEIEIGYWFGLDHHGFGYASETLKHVTLHLRDQFPDMRIFAECVPENHASRRVLVKCGFVPSGPDGKRPGRKRFDLV